MNEAYLFCAEIPQYFVPNRNWSKIHNENLAELFILKENGEPK